MLTDMVYCLDDCRRSAANESEDEKSKTSCRWCAAVLQPTATSYSWS